MIIIQINTYRLRLLTHTHAKEPKYKYLKLYIYNCRSLIHETCLCRYASMYIEINSYICCLKMFKNSYIFFVFLKFFLYIISYILINITFSISLLLCRLYVDF